MKSKGLAASDFGDNIQVRLIKAYGALLREGAPKGRRFFWLPLLDSPLKPLAACALRCAAGRGISSPGPENDAPHRFLYGPSSPTGSGWTRTNDTSQFAIVALRRRERLPCARCSLGFRLAASRTAGARLRPVNSRDAPAAQSRWPEANERSAKETASKRTPFLLAPPVGLSA